jgi:hypothetical protein
MATHASQALVQRILELKETLEHDPDCDMIGIFEHILLDSPYAKLEDATVLAWFPAEVLQEVLRWFEEKVAEEAAEVDDDAE